MTTTSDRNGSRTATASPTAAQASTLAEAAEAEADAAEARAVAARARTLELRRQAEAAKGDVDDGDGVASVNRRRWLRGGRPRRKRPVVGAVVAVAVTCALLGASGYMTWQHRGAVRERDRSAQFAAAARQGVVALTSMDFHTAEHDVQRILDSSTGAFKDDFQSRAGDFTKDVEQSKVVTKGTVNAAAVESMTGASAVVLVAATSEVTNSTGAQLEPRAWRLSVSLLEDAGQIKMSKVEFIP